MKKRNIEPFNVISLTMGSLILFFTLFPIINTISWTKPGILLETFKDKKVMETILFSIKTASISAVVSFLIGTPFAYLMARSEFKFKSVIESIVDIPVVIPHTVAGICLLTVLSPRCFIGKILNDLGIETIGTIVGIVIAMTFVSMPLYINAAKEGFRWVPERMENVSRTLGATKMQTFFLITFKMSLRDILSGVIIAWARAISEFGAVIIIAYHPMIAPTYIYERFTSYGMMYAVPVTTILITICLIIFIIFRIISLGGRHSDKC